MSEEGQRGLRQIFEEMSATLSGLYVDLHGLHRRVQHWESSWLQRASDAPKNFPTYASAICPEDGASFSMSFAVPVMGTVYDLRRLLVTGSLATTTIAGNAFAFVQAADPIETDIAGNACVDFTDPNLGLPATAFYDDSQILLRNPDQLWVVIVGGTAGQQYNATAFWQVYNDGGYQEEVNL